jgi:hypothetical protein
LVKVGDERRDERDAFDPGLQGADDKVMPARTLAGNCVLELGEPWRVGDDAQCSQPPEAKLEARFSRLSRQLPRIDLAIDRAQGAEMFGFKGKAKIGEFLLTLCGDDLLD